MVLKRRTSFPYKFIQYFKREFQFPQTTSNVTLCHLYMVFKKYQIIFVKVAACISSGVCANVSCNGFSSGWMTHFRMRSCLSSDTIAERRSCCSSVSPPWLSRYSAVSKIEWSVISFRSILL